MENIDIKTLKNMIVGRQGWTYICNSGEIPVLEANLDIPQESADYHIFGKVCVKCGKTEKPLSIYGNLIYDDDKWYIRNNGCCISNSFGINDMLDLISNSQAPVLTKDQTVAIATHFQKMVSLELFRINRIDPHCSVVCEFIPLTDDEMVNVVESAEKWCNR